MTMTAILVQAAGSTPEHQLSARIANDTFDLALVVVVVGLVIALSEAWSAAKKKAPHEEHAPAPEVQKGFAVKEILDSAANLSKGLAKVDLGTRVLVIGVVLIAIAGLTASTDNVSGAIGKHGHNKTVINNNPTPKPTHTPRH